MADGPRGRGTVGDRPSYGQLCCGAATKKTVLVYKILGESDEWTLVGSMGVTKRPSANRDGEEVASYIEEADGQVVFKKRPWPLRFQGGVLEVLLWVAGRVVGVALSSKRVREAAPTMCPTSAPSLRSRPLQPLSTSSSSSSPPTDMVLFITLQLVYSISYLIRYFIYNQ